MPVALIDLDCFYCQVEHKCEIGEGEFLGRNVSNDLSEANVVAQYTGGGTLIAVNYGARKVGVKRFMKAKEAMGVCQGLKVYYVPEKNGKADLSRYRESSYEVVKVIDEFFDKKYSVASIDEVFVELSEEMLDRHGIGETCGEINFKVLTSGDEKKNFTYMRYGCLLEKCREEIFKRTGFTCSAGLAKNKTLAKLVSSMNKPNGSTVLCDDGIQDLFKSTLIERVRFLGGKLGESIRTHFNISTMYELSKIGVGELARVFDEKTAVWLNELSTQGGTSKDEHVEPSYCNKTIGCSKNFGRGLVGNDEVHKWLMSFFDELLSRVILDRKLHSRLPKVYIVKFITRKGNSHQKRLQVPANFEMLLDNFSSEVSADGNFCSVVKFFANKGLEAVSVFNVKANEFDPPVSSLSVQFKDFEDLNGCEKKIAEVVKSDNAGFFKCEKCKRVILQSELFEHEDWHYAKELQGVFNREEGGAAGKKVAPNRLEKYFK